MPVLAFVARIAADEPATDFDYLASHGFTSAKSPQQIVLEATCIEHPFMGASLRTKLLPNGFECSRLDEHTIRYIGLIKPFHGSRFPKLQERCHGLTYVCGTLRQSDEVCGGELWLCDTIEDAQLRFDITISAHYTGQS